MLTAKELKQQLTNMCSKKEFLRVNQISCMKKKVKYQKNASTFNDILFSHNAKEFRVNYRIKWLVISDHIRLLIPNS